MPQKQNTELEQINHEIYKRNLELAVVNKTLSLLRKLYQISLEALDPQTLSAKMSEAVRVDLNMELTGMYMCDEQTKALAPLNFSYSKRLGAALPKPLPALLSGPIPDAPHVLGLGQVLAKRAFAMAGSLDGIAPSLPGADALKAASQAANVHSAMLYPLVAQGRCIGAIIFALNREYTELSGREQESIRSLIDVASVALDNALLYVKLEQTNRQLLELDRARAEFISIASHQLRTPPATVKWYLSAVKAGDYGKAPARMMEAIERARITNEGLIGLIDDMLNASRIERGKMEFIFEKCDFAKLVASTVDQLVPQATMHKIRLAYRKPRGKLPEIMADKEKLAQVANNLIDNAIKYSKAGTVKVTLDKEGPDLVLRVSDRGKGMAKEELEAIFQKYGRGKDSQRAASGLGLGLYVAKVIAEHHKGRIWAESPGLGKGSTFVVSLPIKTDLKAETFDLVEAQKSAS